MTDLCMFQIPMLLDDSSQHMLNDSTDLMQDSSLHHDLLETYSTLDELGDVEPMQWGPEAFPNLAPFPDDPGVLIHFSYNIYT
jgi:hypothetical protein